jgi:hypothetical protein
VVTCEGCRDQILICHEIKPSSRNNIDKIQLIPVTLSRLHRFYGGVGKAYYLLSMGPFVKLGNLLFEHDIVQFVARKRVRV